MKNVARSDHEVKNVKRQSGRPGYRPVAATAVLAALLLELSTGCGRTVTDASHGKPDTGLVVVSVLMIVLGVFLLVQVARIVGRIFSLVTAFAQALAGAMSQAFASLLLVLAIAVGTVILAIAVLAT